jgi:hypothetical protein
MIGTIQKPPIKQAIPMLIAILIFNLLLALMCFMIAAQLWRWRNALAQAADALFEADRVTHEALHDTPMAIGNGQVATHGLRQSYRQLAGQVRQIQRVLGIVGWSHQLVRGQRTMLRPMLRTVLPPMRRRPSVE